MLLEKNRDDVELSSLNKLRKRLPWFFFSHFRPECVFSMFLVSFFVQINAGGRKKNTKCRKKHNISVCHPDPPCPWRFSYERTPISFTVLDTPPNNNCCLVSHYSLLVGSHMIHVCFTGSLPSLILNQPSCFRFSPSPRRGSSPRVPCPDTRCRQDARSGISPA